MFSVMFFVMLSVAGITSMVGLIECVNAWLEDHYGLPRHKSAMLVVGSVAVLSVISIMSYDVMSELDMGGMNFNDVMDYFSNQVLLPVGGFLIALYAGWFMPREATRDELSSLGAITYGVWHFLIRFVVPPALLVIFIMGVSG